MSESALFSASKLIWLLAAPSNLIVLLIAGGAALTLSRRARKLGQRAAAGGAALLLACAFLPIGDWLLRPLEHRFASLEACPSRIDGIIVLGGSIGSTSVNGGIEENLNDAADRVRYAATLARQYPEAQILVSGGQTFPRPGARSEAEATAQLLQELGVSRDRIRIEPDSRTTAENASRLGEANALAARRWALVTSAFHMPRAMGVFRQQGVDVVAAPTDWRVDESAPLLGWNVSDRLSHLDLAVKEYVGLVAYRMAGRTNELFPGQVRDCEAQELSPTRTRSG